MSYIEILTDNYRGLLLTKILITTEEPDEEEEMPEALPLITLNQCKELAGSMVNGKWVSTEMITYKGINMLKPNFEGSFDYNTYMDVKSRIKSEEQMIL